MNATADLEQLHADLNSLSANDLEEKYPKLSTQSLKGFLVEELETRISKSAATLIELLHRTHGVPPTRF